MSTVLAFGCGCSSLLPVAPPPICMLDLFGDHTPTQLFLFSQRSFTFESFTFLNDYIMKLQGPSQNAHGMQSLKRRAELKVPDRAVPEGLQ